MIESSKEKVIEMKKTDSEKIVTKAWNLVKVEEEVIPTCEHCNTPIKYCCFIESINGDQLIVGTSCCENFLTRKQVTKAKSKVKEIKFLVDQLERGMVDYNQVWTFRNSISELCEATEEVTPFTVAKCSVKRFKHLTVEEILPYAEKWVPVHKDKCINDHKVAKEAIKRIREKRGF